MIAKFKWTALILLAASLLLGAKSCSLVGASAHLGSPIMHSCQTLSAAAPDDNVLPVQIPEACDILQSQVRAMSDEYEEAIFLTFFASFLLFAWGAGLLLWLMRTKKMVAAP